MERLNELSRWRTQISFLLEDYNTGTVYYERNAGVKRPIGSITKLMIAYLCAVRINEDERILAELVTIDRQAAEVSHDMGRSAYEQMEEGEQYTVEALMEMMLVASSCASTYALVKHILGSEETAVAQMNEAAARMRLSGHFVDITGVSPYNECSARDLAILARRLIAEFPQIFTYTARREVLFRGDVYRSSSSLIRDDMMPGMDGLKSGTLLEAGMCYLGSAVYNGHRVISVVLNAQDKTERDAETAALLEYGLFRANEED
ncbi:MAG: D-alanyl-D-alanine carboxypeptidase [Butyrivibrio sp.]|nr:D-alanyl-D-alanine carboxypeptidase [Butyrivibrio sp.]